MAKQIKQEITSIEILKSIEDAKLKKLVDVLFERKIISDQEKKDILSMEPFAQI